MSGTLDAHLLIRPATAADQATMVEFRLAMFADMSALESADAQPTPAPAGLREANERWTFEHFGREFAAWIADLDGKPVAGVGLLWFAHPPGPANPGGLEAYILNVYTRPEVRRMGLARRLVERAVDEARAAGVRRIWLRASAEGRPLYESMGFRPGNYMELVPGPGAEPAQPAGPAQTRGS